MSLCLLSLELNPKCPAVHTNQLRDCEVSPLHMKPCTRATWHHLHPRTPNTKATAFAPSLLLDEIQGSLTQPSLNTRTLSRAQIRIDFMQFQVVTSGLVQRQLKGLGP